MKKQPTDEIIDALRRCKAQTGELRGDRMYVEDKLTDEVIDLCNGDDFLRLSCEELLLLNEQKCSDLIQRIGLQNLLFDNVITPEDFIKHTNELINGIIH